MTTNHTNIMGKQSAEGTLPTYDLNDLLAWLAPVWPLNGSVAANPMVGLERFSFFDAARMGVSLFQARTLPALWQIRQGAGLTRDEVKGAVQAVASQLTEVAPNGSWEAVLEKLYFTFDEKAEIKEKDPQLRNALELISATAPWRHRLAAINLEMITWLSAFLDEGQAAWSMPGRAAGFYACMLNLLPLSKMGRRQKSIFVHLTGEAVEDLSFLLDQSNVNSIQYQSYLRDQLLALPGWAGFVHWRSNQKDYLAQQKYPIQVVEYLAIRVLVDILLPEVEEKTTEAPKQLQQLGNWAQTEWLVDEDISGAGWAPFILPLQSGYEALCYQLACRWESGLRQKMAQRLVAPVPTPKVQNRADAQVAFCIDVRSEPYRRALEQTGHYETLGFAGFFGLPIAYQTTMGERIKSLPVLLEPAHELKSCDLHGHHEEVEKYRLGKSWLQELKSTYKSIKYNLATPFAAVEALGLPAGLVSLLRNVAPNVFDRFRQWGRGLFYQSVDVAPDVNPCGHHGIPLEQQLVYAENGLRMMGLTDHFAPLVVFCGHGSQTENNPYASAYDCGACGGRHGGPNAAALARILNNQDIRDRLAENGIHVPDDTLFVGAEHNTTTDGVTFVELPKLDDTKKQQIDRLAAAFAKAQTINLENRKASLNAQSTQTLLRKRADWSEVRPEWGLAGNAGLIVGPRHRTAHLDLEGRYFLHSYDWKQDPNHTYLETIMTAPLIVTQWINSQYYFSTVDPVAFGSGNKVTHNVVGKIGIMQGNGSDLMHGLPEQAVQASHDTLYHHPVRLTAFLMAPQSWVEEIIQKHEMLQKLIYNEWIFIQVIDPIDRAVYSLQKDGSWRSGKEAAVVAFI